MPTLYNVQLWLKHAEEARALSAAIVDREIKERMLAVAAGFEHIADLASKLKATSNIGGRAGRCLTSPSWLLEQGRPPRSNPGPKTPALKKEAAPGNRGF